jgi:hypothetical protein
MQINNEILSFDPTTGSILVRYYNDEFPEGFTYGIDVPVRDGQLASQEEINQLIETFKPVGQLERIVALRSVEIPQFLAEKIPAPIPVGIVEEPVDPQE